MTIRVLLADDQELIRTGLRTMLEPEDDLRVVGEAANGREAIDRAAEHRPDVVVMDVRMPVMDGIVATRRLAADDRTAGCRVLVLTTFDLDVHVFEALRAGACGFLLKDTPRHELVDAVRTVAAGDALLSPSITRTLIGEFTRQRVLDAVTVSLLDRVTDRERDVLLAAAAGASNAEIAAALFMGAGTVKTHISHLLVKLGVKDRAQLVVFAYESGLVQPGRSA